MAESQRRILLLNGPNLNLLGTREPQIYGAETLDDVVQTAKASARKLDAHLEDFQSNHEGAIVDSIHQARKDGVCGIIINAGAYTHTSVAIRDALLGVGIPFVELHVSNVHAREPFRHHSYLSDKAVAVIVGFGAKGYEYALDFVATSPNFAST
ncbi:3-dehydroquinate dehydratase [Moniliophthora roreri MCA 2997]|uniref:Catabolic 3-dehydroquinase n=1 Tax=Moniliophthora roreri (strain MCA 2997) TaxID=1381753 RepID=V2WTN0_MONRO|nr:3-dehydroquinate dehydratase [Moniliophthora roreri MCA 2997]